MTELRRDPVVNRWVIVRVNEPWAPKDYEKQDNDDVDPSASPFCHNREYLTPPEVDAIRPSGSRPNAPDWSVRIVPNKFPALKIEGDLDKKGFGVYDISNGIGAHEVVIETPDPIKQMADYSAEEMKNVIHMYIKRSIDLSGDKRFRYILIFKNFGKSAGASVAHAHSQMIALPMVPKYVQEKIETAQNYYQYRGRSIFQDMLDQEYQDKKRIIVENDHFVAFCPFVPRYSFEVSIFPKNVNSRFVALNDAEQSSLGEIMKNILKRYKVCLDNPSFNYYFHVQPVNFGFDETFLWHVEIVPKLTRSAIFEWGTGFHVVHTPPEMAAEYLRNVSI